METIIFGFVTSFMIVLLSTPALIKVAHMKRLVDEPGDARKLHNKRIPTIGGIMIFAGALFSYFLWYPFNDIREYGHLLDAINDFKYIGASMLILFFVGVKDDIIGTAPVKKLVGHLMVAFILVFMADIRITSMYGLFGIYEIDLWISVFLSVFTYTVIVNAFNLIDGVDGLAAGVGAIVSIAFGIWFYMAGGIENACLSFALAGALMGFLVFNFSPAKIFMGDAGSLTIGVIISVLAIKLIEFDKSEMPGYMQNIHAPVFAMAVLAYPLVDTLRVFTVRAIKGHSPFSPDKNHIHHRLLAIGLKHSGAVIVLYIFNILVVGFVVVMQLQINYAFAVVGLFACLLMLTPFLFKKKQQKLRSKIYKLELEQKNKVG